jgi:hypothetical protein
MSLDLIKVAFAAGAPVTEPGNPLALRFNKLADVLGFAMNVVFYVGISLTVIFLIIGGIRYITSGGDKTGVEGARGAITNAIIGFVIVIGAFAIKIIIKNVLGATGDIRTLPNF